MTERRLFVSPSDWSEDHIVVREEQAHHLRHVLRAQGGEEFEFIDGQGRWARAIIETLPTRGEIECRIQAQRSTPAPPEDRFVLLQSLIRFEKFEWILEKATELGVTKIVPVVAGRTDAKWREVTSSRRQRWEKILIESIKQCRRPHLPRLSGPLRFETAIGRAKAEYKMLLSERPEARSFKRAFRDAQANAALPTAKAFVPRVVLAIGPEGGWAREEESYAARWGFTVASLGEAILRAETAAIAALAIVGQELEAAVEV